MGTTGRNAKVLEKTAGDHPPIVFVGKVVKGDRVFAQYKNGGLFNVGSRSEVEAMIATVKAQSGRGDDCIELEKGFVVW